MHREATLQQQDPVDSVGFVRLFAIGTAILTTTIAIVMTAFEADEVSDWPMEIAAIVLLVVTGLLFIGASSPFRAPFRRWRGVLIVSLTLVCFLLDETAQLGTNRVIHDDWGLFVIPFYLFVLATLRPVRDLLVIGAVATGIVVLTTVLESPFILIHAAPFTRGLVGVTSIVPAALGSALFSSRLVRGVRDAPEEASGPMTASAELRQSVQDESILQLQDEIVPLLSSVVAAKAITADDSHRARELAISLRGVIVADLARDWLAEAGLVVDDPDGYAERMTQEQRTTLLGLLGAMPVKAGPEAGTIEITGQDFNAELDLRVPLTKRPTALRVGPAVLLLRTVFPHVRMHLDDLDLRVTADFSV